MKTLNLSKWKLAASLGLATLFTLSVAQAATITWIGQGTFSDNTYLTNAGTVANVIYGVDFGGSGSLTTANGYSFVDGPGSGNFTVAGGPSSYGGYLNGQTSGDANLNTILADGYYGSSSANPGTLHNLTIGNSYNVLVFIDDNRGGARGGNVFQVNDGTANSPQQTYASATPGSPLGGYLLGTFTATATTQTLTVENGNPGNAQYNGVLLISNTPPVVPSPVLVTNTQPVSAVAGIGGQVVFTAAFSTSPPVNVQWQFVSGGVTNPVSAGNAGVVTLTNNGVVSSTLTFTNLQATNSASYLLKAVNATNSLGVTYSSAAPLAVNSLIFWSQTGTFTNDSFLALAGTAANEVYGVDFGVGAQTTANGYNFTDAWNGSAVTGNMGMAGNVSEYNAYFPLPTTTGDGALDNIINCGLYGSVDMMGTLSNLVVGQTYNVLVILDDTRTGPISNPTQVPQTVFYATDGVSVSPYETFVFPGATNASGGNAIGAYALGTFTAQSTTEPLSILTQDLVGQFGLTAQYNAILVETNTTAPSVPPIYLNANTFPVPASSVLPLYFPAQSNFPIPTSDAPLAGEPAAVDEDGNIGFSAAFVNYYSPLNLQWQVITNGVTNNINSGVFTVTNLGIVSSTLTLSNLQLSASGSSYQLKAVNATNSSDVAYSTPYPLLVVPVITWGATGTFTSDSVLSLVGTPANEVYGVAFFGFATNLTTANGYTFSDYTSGNMSIAGSPSFYGLYLGGSAVVAGSVTTGDTNFDGVLTEGAFGTTANTGTLNNLTIGQKYTVLALLDDTRGGAAGGTNFVVTDGVTTSPSQPYALTNGTPAVGGYIMGTFTATATTQSYTVENLSGGGPACQYNAILLEKFTAVTPPRLGAPKVSGGNLILTGTGGTPDAGYTLLTTTNLTIPLASWTVSTNGTLDGTGAFSNAIPINASQRAALFRLELP